MLNPSDYVGVTFWLLSAAMVAATFFFWVERDRAVGKWKTSLTVAAMVTGIAAIHYFYMRGVWIDTGSSPTVFRYVDWLLTVPLQIVEFYLIPCCHCSCFYFCFLAFTYRFCSYVSCRLHW
jgi:bacteriorhodopsin